MLGGTADHARNVISDNGTGILLYGATANRVEGNYIGTDATGSVSLGNTGTGIWVLDSDDNVIGGSTALARNLISGNSTGVTIQRLSLDNRIEGNYIGTNAAGQASLGNGTGIRLLGCSWNVVGGVVTGAGNIISGNLGTGVYAMGWFVGPNSLFGNFIGVAADRTNALMNGGSGVSAFQTKLTVGGESPGEPNVIAFNGGDGVDVFASNGIRVRGNSIYANAGLGIDLLPAGVTPNDAEDLDTDYGYYGNDLQNYPVLTYAASGAGRPFCVGPSRAPRRTM